MKLHLTELLAQAAKDIAPGQTCPDIVLERPKTTLHGDFACNLAMLLAKPLRQSPRAIADAIVKALPASAYVAKVEIAGAGFINFFLAAGAKQGVVHEILAQGAKFGYSNAGQGKKIQVEFVSANPTGPLHVGHGRGAAYGASLSNLLETAGWQVAREYYVNDAGRQMDILALSTWLRYLELHGEQVPFPPNAYQGDYVRDMARQIQAAHGKRYVCQATRVLAGTPGLPDAERDDKEAASRREAHLDALIAKAKELLGEDYAYIHNHALTEQLGDCREDLAEFGVTFDTWFSEKSLFDSGLVERAVELLDQHGHLYQQDGATWFRSTTFSDEKDRVVKRENGQFTYFASDIAYHFNKFERGFDLVINVWGADHHGYIARVKGALQALALDTGKLLVALVQFAVLYRGGDKVPMSTRSGQFVTLRELRSEVGNDAARFFYVLRKSEQHLDFDLDLAKSQSNDNPVYYIQYAHARICSVLNQWGGNPASLKAVDLSTLTEEHELTLLQRLAEFPETIENAAQELAPHVIAYYLKDLAGELHSYYNAQQFLVADEALRNARLALILATRQVLQTGLRLLGVSAPEKM